MSVNKVILVGRLTKDPDARFMPNGEAVTGFSVATSEQWKDKAGDKQEKSEFHNCTAFRGLGEVCGKYLKKGAQVYIEGKLTTEKWADKEGKDRYTTKIIVNEMKMLGRKPAGEQGENQEKPAGKPAQQEPKQGGAFDNFDDDPLF